VATTIEHVRFVEGGHWTNKRALELTDTAARECLVDAGLQPDDVDLLINTGLYRDRILGEPALASLVQEDVGINPEDPHSDGHGSFSFDVANGACGVLTAIQIADRFLQAGTIETALIVTSDADPGHHLAPSFPFRPAGGAVLCRRDDTASGMGEVHWTTRAEDGHAWRATVGYEETHNRLRFEISEGFAEVAGVAAAQVTNATLRAAGLVPHDLAVVVASPAHPAFIETYAARSGIDVERIITSENEQLHTVSFVAALRRADESGLLTRNGIALFVCAGSGITAGAALYRSG
jgi:3-oxoacyl-[acyl-carrier-protein] synthase-3